MVVTSIGNRNSKPNVFLICTGLGNVARGYESFTRECFDSLKENSQFNLILFKGGGKNAKNEYKLQHIKKNSRAAIIISRMTGASCDYVEQFTFFLSLIPQIVKYKPKVIFYSDVFIGTLAWKFRKIFKVRYKILLSNGAPFNPPFEGCDHVQQLLPVHYNTALKLGYSQAQQDIVPYGINMAEEHINTSCISKVDAREKLSLSLNSFVILSVGAINKRHKRVDYLLKECAKLQINDLRIIVLGQFDEESNEILALADSLGLKGNATIKTVAHSEVGLYYAAADVFTLASLSEGLPRVLLEALKYGLPVFAHDYPVAKETLSQFGYYGDFSKPGSLSTAIQQYYNSSTNQHTSTEIRRYVYNTFSWDCLRSGYLQMINDLITK